ncbi:MAG: hypothetical protein M1816_002010 [Peltula sp. TS41687]|nr:MAG: hypothetical protein M1816_002010 [Peltula sp. TS41687]
MLGIGEEERPSSKCYVTCGALQSYINREQPPTKKQPYSTIRSNHFNHTVELILPEQAHHDKFLEGLSRIKYCTVILSLEALLERDFLTTYIKNGNIIMLSEGRVGIDNTFRLSDGLLRLSLDRETYERAGLVGKPDGSAKTKRGKSRWVVEINLRLPSMVHGKKGYQRLLRACENVLKGSVQWLFCDLDQNESSPNPIDCHHPTHKLPQPELLRTPLVRVPRFDFEMSSSDAPTLSKAVEMSTVEKDFQERAIEYYEYLNLVCMESPRIVTTDAIDPFLSRYNVPVTEKSVDARLVRLRWKGFLPARWIAELWMMTLSSLASSSDWFSLIVSGFEGRGFTILRQPQTTLKGAREGQQHQQRCDTYLLWEVEEGP